MAGASARHRARRYAVGVLATTVVATAGCSSTSHVDLASARVPAVQPADGSQGQTDAGVIPAGAIDLDDDPVETSTTSTVADSTSTTQADAGDELSPEGEQMIKELCRDDKRELRLAVEAYRDDFGTTPTSEGELVAMAYVSKQSDVYDVQLDGSIVAQGDTCAKTP